jgi:hypothetical protein
MVLFRRRDGEPVDVPNVHAHEVTLSRRRNDTQAQAAEVRARIATLEAEQADAALELRFDDQSAAAELLEAARSELVRLDATCEALLAAEHAVNAEKQQIDMHTRIAELQQDRDTAMARCQQKLADLPIVVAELQQMARAALADEADLQAAYQEIKYLHHQLAHFGQASFAGQPRYAVPAPVSAAFERHPEYRALSNKKWYIGQAGGPVPN